MELDKKLEDNDAVVGVIGLGYVGLPLATAFAEAGLYVLGFDMQKDKVLAVNKGESYISDISRKRLSKVVKENKLKATGDYHDMEKADVICICVPTPLTKTKEPDLTYVINVSEMLCRILRKGQLIVLESTTYPGTTRELVQPILERSGLKAGQDFYLAFSPERVDPSNKKYTIKNTPKVVGGINAESTRLTKLLYQKITKLVLPVSSPDVAEMTKLFENVFRSVNIALVNELASLCENMGISVWEVIDTASSKPFGFMPFYPGPGVGGHCIPLDPYYLSSKAREFAFHTKFIELAAEINENMPQHIAHRVMEALNTRGKSLKNAKLLVLGTAYKKDVTDTRESPCIKLMEILQSKGAKISYNDPYVPNVTISGEIMTSKELTSGMISSFDCVIIATNHSQYDYTDIVGNASLVFDTRGVTRHIKDKQKKIFRFGE